MSHEIGRDLRGVERSAPGSQLAGGEIGTDLHFSIATRTPPGGGVAGICRASLGRLGRGGEKFTGECQQCGAPRVSEESELPDANETARKNMLGKTAQKLSRRKSHFLLLFTMRVIFPAEGDMHAVESQQAVIADGDAVRVPAEITEHLGGRSECRLGVYDPPLLESESTKMANRLGFASWAAEPEKTSFPSWNAFRKPSTNLALKTELSTFTGKKKAYFG